MVLSGRRVDDWSYLVQERTTGPIWSQRGWLVLLDSRKKEWSLLVPERTAGPVWSRSVPGKRSWGLRCLFFLFMNRQTTTTPQPIRTEDTHTSGLRSAFLHVDALVFCFVLSIFHVQQLREGTGSSRFVLGSLQSHHYIPGTSWRNLV